MLTEVGERHRPAGWRWDRAAEVYAWRGRWRVQPRSFAWSNDPRGPAGKGSAAGNLPAYSGPGGFALAQFARWRGPDHYDPRHISGRERRRPHTVTAAQAQAIFKEWIGKKRYVPKGFYAADRVDQLTGLYFPVYSVDAALEVEVEGLGTKRIDSDQSYRLKAAGEVQIENLAVVLAALTIPLFDLITGGKITAFSSAPSLGTPRSDRRVHSSGFQVAIERLCGSADLYAAAQEQPHRPG